MQESIKNIFDKRTKGNDFQIGDKVLKWDWIREDKAKHGKYENIGKGPYIIHSTRDNNAFFLQEQDRTDFFGGPVNGRMLKNYFY